MKRLIAWVLVLTLIFSCLPEGFAEQAETGNSGYVAVQTENGTTLRDQVIRQTLVLTDEDSLYLDGVIATNGNGIRVEGGNHVISRDAVIKGDIVISGPCDLRVDGLVEGDIRIDCPAWEANDPRHAEYAEKGLQSEVSLQIGEHAVVHGITGTNFMGYIEILGNVTNLSFDTANDRGGEYLSNGWVSINGNAYVYDIHCQGDVCPGIEAGGNSLVSSILVDGHSFVSVDSTVTSVTGVNGANVFGQSNARIGTLRITGGDSYCDLSGSHVDTICLEATSRQVTAARDGRKPHVGLMKGAQARDVTLSGCVDFVNTFFLVDDLVPFLERGTAPEAILWDELGAESQVEHLTAQGNCTIWNQAYIGHADLKKGVRYHGEGYCKQIDAEGVKDLALYLLNWSTGEVTNVDQLVSMFIASRYHNRMFCTLYAKDSEVFFGYLSGGGTALLDGCNLQFEDFEHYDTICINDKNTLFVYRGLYQLGEKEVVPSYAIDYLIWNGNLRYAASHFDNYHLHHIRDLCIIRGIMPLYGDVDRLLLYEGAENARLNSSRTVLEGRRPDPVPADRDTEADVPAAEAVQEEGETEEKEPFINPDSFYVFETASVPRSNASGRLQGGPSANKPATLAEGEYVFAKTEQKNWWYTLPCQPLQTLVLTLDAGEGMGLMTLRAPDGTLYSTLSDGDKGKIEVLSETEGEWKLCLIGGLQDYTLKVDRIEPARIHLNGMLQKPDLNGAGEQRKLDFTAEQLTVTDASGQEIPFIFNDQCLVMTDAAAHAGAELTLSIRDDNGLFVPAALTVFLGAERQASLDVTVYAYGSYRVTCEDTESAHITLYDGNGDFYTAVPNIGGVFQVARLAPGDYQALMMRGDVGNWQFSDLSELVAYGFTEITDYRLDRFTLLPGYDEFYPMATIPQEPTVCSEWLKDGTSSYTASSASCRVGGSVRMKLSFTVLQPENAHNNTVLIDIPEGMTVDPANVILSGGPCDCRFEEGVLSVPVTGMEDISLEFYLSCSEAGQMQTVARMVTETESGTAYTYLGGVILSASVLSITGPVRAGTHVNLFGIARPRENVAILMNGTPVTSVTSDAAGNWTADVPVPAGDPFADLEFRAALDHGTEAEVLSEPLVVTVDPETPEVESVSLYYYEHEFLRKLELSAAQLSQGKLRYNYLPGSAFTWRIRMTQNESLTGLYFVKEYPDGTVEYLPCTYDGTDGVWVYSGTFPTEGSSEPPLPFHLAYQQAEPEMPESAPVIQIEALETRVRETWNDEEDNTLALIETLAEGEVISTVEETLDWQMLEDDPIRAQEEALTSVTLDDGSLFCLMGDPEKPEDWSILYFDAEDLISVPEEAPEGAEEAKSAFSVRLSALLRDIGLISSAGAEEADLPSWGTYSALLAYTTVNIVGGDIISVFNLYFGIGQELALIQLREKTVGLMDYLSSRAVTAKNWQERQCWLLRYEEAEALKKEIEDLVEQYKWDNVKEGLLTLITKVNLIKQLGEGLKPSIQAFKNASAKSNRLRESGKVLRSYLKELDESERLAKSASVAAKEKLDRLLDAWKTAKNKLSGLKSLSRADFNKGVQQMLDKAASLGAKFDPSNIRNAMDQLYNAARNGLEHMNREELGKACKELADSGLESLFSTHTEEWIGNYSTAMGLLFGTLPEISDIVSDQTAEAIAAAEEDLKQKQLDEENIRQEKEKTQSDIESNDADQKLAEQEMAQCEQAAENFKRSFVSQQSNQFMKTMYDLYLKSVDEVRQHYSKLEAEKYDSCLVTIVVTDAEMQYDGAWHTVSGQPVTATDFAAQKGKNIWCIAFGLPDDDALLSIGLTCSAGEEVRDVGKYEVTAAHPVFSKGGHYATEIRYQGGKSAATFEILPQPLTIRAHDAQKVYDQTPLTCDQTEPAKGSMLNAYDVLEGITVTGSRTEIGEADNVPSNAVIRSTAGGANANMLQNFDITYKPGTLTVTDPDATTPPPSATPAPLPTPTPTPEDEPLILPEPEDSTLTLPPKDGPRAPDSPGKDPSGYVYEGIWSNRLSDVKVSAFTLDGNNETVLWDAADYGQQNPTDTDEKGYYEWYVPDGYWQVLYEKDGYESALSDWMEVPPPRTEVHQGLVSLTPAAIDVAVSFPDFVEVLFSRPVQVDTIQPDTLSIGSPYTVEALDPERGGTSDVILAKRFRLHPVKKARAATLLTLTDRVISYAGVPCEPAEVECSIRPWLKEIQCEGSVTMHPGEVLDIPVSLICNGDASVYSCTVAGAHPDLLLAPEALSFDAKGQGSLHLEAVTTGQLLLVIRSAMPQTETVLQVTISNAQ